MLQELPHQRARHRFRRVHGYHKVADGLGLLVFQRLDEGHVAIHVHAERVVRVVELVGVQADLLGHGHELAQEVGVVVGAAVGEGQRGHQVAGLVAPFLRERLQVHLDFLGELLPVAPLLLVVVHGRVGLDRFEVAASRVLGVLVGRFVVSFVAGALVASLRAAAFLLAGLVVAQRLGLQAVVLEVGVFVVFQHLLGRSLLVAGAVAFVVRVGGPCGMVVAFEQLVPLVQLPAADALVMLAFRSLRQPA